MKGKKALNDLRKVSLLKKSFYFEFVKIREVCGNYTLVSLAGWQRESLVFDYVFSQEISNFSPPFLLSSEVKFFRTYKKKKKKE